MKEIKEIALWLKMFLVHGISKKEKKPLKKGEINLIIEVLEVVWVIALLIIGAMIILKTYQ